ncbi:PR-1-like protein [Artomyces pyxidatus]|uniref:PR-1-like protein n=1 Tax=Artomyces pyxidatus TaxID=48021 RepID=A0ACB8TH03_9AGAM|nr:PR-1-like protein [Artomyces pyxidatus]
MHGASSRSRIQATSTTWSQRLVEAQGTPYQRPESYTLHLTFTCSTATANSSGVTIPAIAAPSPQTTLFTPTSSSVASTSTSPAAPKSSAPSSSLALKGVLGGAPSPSSSTTSEKPKTTSAPPPPPAPTTSSAPPPPPPPPPPPTTTPKPKPAPTSTAPPPPPTETSGSSGGSTSGGSSGDDGATSASDIAAYLSAHNSVRSAHGASDLTWSDSLAATAQGWANNCVFKHSGGTLGPFGENLAAGTGSSYGIPEAIKSWTDEVSQYDSSNPVPSHFTQVVWKASTQVGCAVQSCDGIFAASLGKAKYYVCEYSPQGNIIGQFGYVARRPYFSTSRLMPTPTAKTSRREPVGCTLLYLLYIPFVLIHLGCSSLLRANRLQILFSVLPIVLTKLLDCPGDSTTAKRLVIEPKRLIKGHARPMLACACATRLTLSQNVQKYYLVARL